MSEAVAVVKPQGQRLVSVDALRGFDMLWIIGGEAIFESLKRISNGGFVQALANQFHHRPWEGLVFFDLIFPLFVFIIGISVVFSLDKILAEEGKRAAYKRIFRRFVLMFLLAIFYDEGVANWHDENVLCGVLQRLALSYLFASLLYVNFKLKGLIVAFLVLLLGYWALLSFVPVPGTGQVSFAPDRNWTHFIDRQIPPYYDTDPEGYLSTTTAVATCLLGVFAGLTLKNKSLAGGKKALAFIAAGAALAIVGYLWGIQMPVIKKLWTSSYVLVAGGYSCILLGVFYQIVDVWQYRKWAMPFVWIGSNALTIYMLAENQIIDFHKLAERLVGGDVAAAFGRYGELVITIVALGMCIVLVRFLYKKQIFLRV